MARGQALSCRRNAAKLVARMSRAICGDRLDVVPGVAALTRATFPSVQPKLRNVPRIGFQFAALDALDDVRQHGIGAAGKADLLALRTTRPLRNSISVRRPFCMSWPMEGRCP